MRQSSQAEPNPFESGLVFTPPPSNGEVLHVPGWGDFVFEQRDKAPPADQMPAMSDEVADRLGRMLKIDRGKWRIRLKRWRGQVGGEPHYGVEARRSF